MVEDSLTLVVQLTKIIIIKGNLVGFKLFAHPRFAFRINPLHLVLSLVVSPLYPSRVVILLVR